MKTKTKHLYTVGNIDTKKTGTIQIQLTRYGKNDDVFYVLKESYVSGFDDDDFGNYELISKRSILALFCDSDAIEHAVSVWQGYINERAKAISDRIIGNLPN